MKKIFAMLVVLSMLLVTVGALAEATTLKAGINPEWAPFESLDDAGNIVGFDADLVTAINAQSGLNIVFESTNFDSIITGVQTGLYDLGISCISVTEERQVNVDFTTPYLTSGPCLVSKLDGGLTDSASLMGKRIGGQSGTTGIEKAEELTDQDNVFSYTKALDAVMDLVKGNLDAVIVDKPVAQQILTQLNNANLAISDTVTFDPEEYAIAIAKGKDDIKAKLNTAIEALTADGTIATLADKWDVFGTKADAE